MLDLLAERELKQAEVALHLDFAHVHVGLGELELAIDRLERAADQRNAGVLYLGLWPHWAPLKGIARFDALLQRVRPSGSVS